VTVDDLSSIFDHQRPPLPAKYTSYLFRHTSHHITPPPAKMCFGSRRKVYYEQPPAPRVHMLPRSKYQRDLEKYGPHVAKQKRSKRRTNIAVAAYVKPPSLRSPYGYKGKRKLTSCEVPQHDPSPNRVVNTWRRFLVSCTMTAICQRDFSPSFACFPVHEP
jgi:hypothetical protein